MYVIVISYYLIVISCQKLEKLREEGQVEKPFERKQLKIRFPERGRSGRTVLMVKNLNFGYGDNVSNFCLLNVNISDYS